MERQGVLCEAWQQRCRAGWQDQRGMQLLLEIEM